MSTHRNAQPNTDAEPGDSAAQRRVPQWTSEEQGSGNGSATALTKMKMLERKKSQCEPRERPSGE